VVPGTVYLLIGGGLLVAALDGAAALRKRKLKRLAAVLLENLVLPFAVAGAAWWAASHTSDLLLQVLVTLAIVTPMGPMLYRLAFQPAANAPVLVLLIIAVAVHYMMTGLGLVFFGGEGVRTHLFQGAPFQLGVLSITVQSLAVVSTSLVLIALLAGLFGHTVYGKALRAAALNRVGARLVGISSEFTGRLSFGLAALIGAVSGILISPITTIYYDTGFIISLKGFVGAIIGGMTNYPLAAFGSLIVGFLESYSSFWASTLKESIVFTLIIPVLLWRSLTTHRLEEDEEP
jgi:branched-chain amino acid transport system permease protein